MSAMTRFTLRSLRANRVRTLVTVAGVALAAALLTAVLTTYTSLQSMLCQAEVNLSGTWMAEVSDADRARLDAEVAAGLASGELSDAAVLQDVGFGGLTEKQQNIHGRYLVLMGFSGDIGELCAVHPSTGRLPEAPDEIMLFDLWRLNGGLAVGDTITLPVGDRMAVLAPGKEGVTYTRSVEAGAPVDFSEEGADVIADGTLLDSSIGYLEARNDQGLFNEELVNATERTYTVTGFYDSRSSLIVSNGAGMTAFVGGDPQGTGVARAYVAVADADSTEAVEERVNALFESGQVVLHTAMLRYMGVQSEGAVWETFFGIAAVLAVVIVVACVSLIYNAFAISVAERLRQFGLLASIGASRRQLRRAVALEAAVVALIGVPVGLLVGIAGCAVTFALIGPSLATVFGAANVGFVLVVAPWALVLAAAFTVVTVLVSAAVPAIRAGRVNVIDALRGGQVDRASKRGAARAARAVVPSRLWARRGLAGRVFGMGGLLARINAKRGTGRGRAASVSLALAIVLLMTAGSLSTFLGMLTDVAGGEEPPADVAVFASLQPFEADGAAEDAAPTTAEEAVRASNERFAAEAALFAGAWEALCATPGAEPEGWRLDGYASVIMPEAMAGELYRTEGNGAGGLLADGRYAANASLVYVDDETFDRFAADQGLDPADYHDADRPRAIGVARGYGNNGQVYQLFQTLRAPGTLEVVSGGAYDGQVVDGFSLAMDMDAPDDGAVHVTLEPFVLDYGEDDSATRRAIDPSLAEMVLEPLEVPALVDEVPPLVGMRGEQLQLVMPLSTAQHHGFGVMFPTFRAAFDAPGDETGVVAQALVDCLGTFIHDEPDYEASYLGMNDYAANQESNRMLALVVNVFCLLFTVILALIALANVFNTVTNGLILRRREFAVMRATGLSNRQFRAMIVDECAAWCLRGLVPGILLSLGVSYLLFSVVSGSITGIVFALPWGYVALAFAMTAAAIGISVAYGMHRCKADSVVEALRMDNA